MQNFCSPLEIVALKLASKVCLHAKKRSRLHYIPCFRFIYNKYCTRNIHAANNRISAFFRDSFSHVFWSSRVVCSCHRSSSRRNSSEYQTLNLIYMHDFITHSNVPGAAKRFTLLFKGQLLLNHSRYLKKTFSA